MDVGQHAIIARGGRGRFDVDDEMRTVLVAVFSEMRLVADPTQVAFVSKAGLRIVRGRLPFG